MKHYGIIGNPLDHSFSARYFSRLFLEQHIDAEYQLYPLASLDTLPDYIGNLNGFNVTRPYKQTIIPFLDELDETARVIGAVNVVKRIENAGKIIHRGYNTDCVGFISSIKPYLRTTDHYALVFGTGGAAKAVAFGLHQLGIKVTLVSRTKGLTYAQLTPSIIAEHSILINCTPLGMIPEVDTAVDIPYHAITSMHLCFDCVYNPEQTRFLVFSKQYGARTLNGLGMLLGQARAAWEIWNNN